MIDINESLFIQICNFLLLFFLLNWLLYRPIRNILLRRKEAKEGLSEAAQKAIQNSEVILQQISDRLKEAHQAGREKFQALLDAAKETEKEELSQMRKTVEKELAIALTSLTAEKKEVLSKLDEQMEDLAKRIGHQILGRELS